MIERIHRWASQRGLDPVRVGQVTDKVTCFLARMDAGESLAIDGLAAIGETLALFGADDAELQAICQELLAKAEAELFRIKGCWFSSFGPVYTKV